MDVGSLNTQDLNLKPRILPQRRHKSMGGAGSGHPKIHKDITVNESSDYKTYQHQYYQKHTKPLNEKKKQDGRLK